MNIKAPQTRPIVANGAAYFLGGSGTERWGLYRTDLESVRLVRELAFRTSPPPVVFGDRIVFYGGDPVWGFEPWISDGTPEDTVPIADIRPGAEGRYIELHPFAPLGDVVYFAANDGTHGVEPWILRRR